MVAKEVSTNVKTKNTFKYQIPTNLKNFGQIREIELLPKFPIMSHSAHWGFNPSSETPPFFFTKPPLKFAHCPSPPPFLGNSPIYTIVLREAPLKVWIFQGTSIILKFFILNPIRSFKIAKLLVKIFQFKLSVMTEKNTFFVIKHFGFSFIFYVKTAKGSPVKGHSSLSQQPTIKTENLSSPSSRKGGGGGVHTMRLKNA